MMQTSRQAANFETRARQLCADLGLDADQRTPARNEYGAIQIVPTWMTVAEELRWHLAITQMIREMGL